MRRIVVELSGDESMKLDKLTEIYGSVASVVRTAINKLYEVKLGEDSFERVVLQALKEQGEMLKVLKEDVEKIKSLLGVKK